jgi:predicted ATPase/DNA-binding winged helix-turn-helix (wHTH) protein
MGMRRGRGDVPPAVRIEPANEWAWCGERRLELTPKAFAVLRYLVARAGRLITKDDLLTTVWRDAVVSDAALTSCIRDLRRALRDSSQTPRYIETVHRRGFRFIGPHAVSTAEPALHPAPAPTDLVGRDAELARLRDLFARGMTGRRQLIFVTGEPGIGKTALVEAFLAEIGGRETLAIGRGQCIEHYGAGEAYLPLLEALGRLGRAPRGERVVQALARYAPTWLTQLPALLADEELEAVQRRAQGATRDRMLREMVEALDALSVDEPLVLLLEDLHWSDASTIDLLARWAGRREPARLLVLGTYRPADIAAASHPLRTVKQQLQIHAHCEELPLAFLDEVAVSAYLARRFSRHGLPPELARVVHRMTGGNPLFVVNVVDDWIAQGQVSETDGTWALTVPVEDVAAAGSRTLGQMVDKQVERLAADEQAVLAVASVAGAEFSAGIVDAGGIDAHTAELVCETLARRGQFLRAAGVAEWPDGTVAGRYAFIHALYQQALYARVPMGERVALHRSTGERLERGYGARAGDIAGELAMHFEQGRDAERAVRYRRHAGEHALGQHAYREAADHAKRALTALADWPVSSHRTRQELALQVLLGAALTPTYGYAVPDVARAYARARELCVAAGDTALQFPVLIGLGRFYLVRGELDTARAIASELLTTAEAMADIAPRLAGHNAVGVVSFYSGDFAAALAHLEEGIALYDPNAHGPMRSPVFQLGQDPGVSCTTHAAMALWMLGYPERAATRSREAIALAHTLDHPFSVSYACHFAAGLHQWRRDRRAMQHVEDEARPLDAEHGFGLFETAGAIQRGWLSARDGHERDAVAQMREGIAHHRAIGAEVLVPAFLGLVAEVHVRLGQRDEGLAAVSEAFAAAQQTGQHYWEAELHRLRGALSLQAGVGGAPAHQAESCFRQALDLARRQQAKSLELRAATSLSRLWADQRRTDEARALLSDVYAWFTEGFDTPDLADARVLLEALGRSAGGRARRARPAPEGA